jgi:CRP/FNR family transcriptional regulator, anaerobic regulatory protein
VAMTSDVKARAETRSANVRSTQPAIPAKLGAQAAAIRTRRGQSIALAFDGGETAFVIRSGVLTLHLTLPRALRQVVAILYPGDMLRSAFVPPDAAAALTAMSAGEVWRLRWSTFEALAAKDLEITRYFGDAVANQTARQAIHVTAIGQFDCEQRVATFLMELALRTGRPSPGGGMVFDMPLGRSDIADYLGLNPDTLSRTMSRLRSTGLLSHPERNRAAIRDLAALAALSPAARSLLALYGEG